MKKIHKNSRADIQGETKNPVLNYRKTPCFFDQESVEIVCFKETVIPVKTGIHSFNGLLDSHFRGNDIIRNNSSACQLYYNQNVFFKCFIIIIFSFFLNSCDFFSTRNSEQPNSGKTSFKPPTSYEIVLQNFINSITEKNVDNYIKCFSDTLQNECCKYTFYPSREAYDFYSSIFNEWDLTSERKYFSAFIASVQKETIPEIMLTQTDIDNIVADSAVLVRDYTLSFVRNLSGKTEKYSGRLIFTIIPGRNGLWSIFRWTDMKASSDSESNTWSLLKALKVI